jgi:ribosomal protein S27AE
MKTEEIDFPFDAVVAEAEQLVMQGHHVHQKFTCVRCGARQTMAEANRFFTTGHCEECNFVSILDRCNYLVIIGDGPV